MVKKFTTLIVLLLISLFFINSIGMSESIKLKDTSFTLSLKTIYVDDDNTQGPWDGSSEFPYQYISDGIYNSTKDDEIYVFSGTYFENISVNKPITIIGENKDSTIIDGTFTDVVIEIIADNVNFANFTVKNSGGYMHNAGIKVHSEFNIITDCNIYRTKTGIYLNKSHNNLIHNCILHTNGESIFMLNSLNNIVLNCYITHCGIGIHLRKSQGFKIVNTYLHTCGFGAIFNSSSEIEIIHSAICDNNDNQGGIHIIRSTNLNFKNCNIYHNGFGVNIVNSSNINFLKSDIKYNTHSGIDIESNSKNINIKNCDIAYNFRLAINIDELSCLTKESSCIINNNNLYNNNIIGLNCKSSYCDARKNWWGFIFGPTLIQFGIADRVVMKLGRMKLFPWNFLKIKNIGSDWETDEFFNIVELPDDVHKQIEYIETDTDEDGCPDWWEEKWDYDPEVFDDHINLDPDEDALNNIEECFTDQWNSSPFYKDIFIELDYVATNNPDVSTRPSDDLMEEIESVYAKKGINLHIDYGSLGGGGELPHVPYFSLGYIPNFEVPMNMYWNYFLNNDLDNPRKGIFHYGFISEFGPSGGNAFFGWDHVDSYVLSIQELERSGPYPPGWSIAVKVLHENGHTLGLFVDDHEGIDNFAASNPKFKEYKQYRNYKSSMNYGHTWEILDYSDGSHGKGDFDDWSNIDFSFFKNTHFEWPKN